ncbi:hypothetical protein AMELA_G00106490 [Ameiurus melas]|uniref:Uncharacterized protein n=1 Tax=Ameiurus melas TaxID=219545 RepID=A0A7J6AXX4_AMEME|nr:hypothetical protein AMELA_G00106490 [Ameiurus melas]
MTGEELEVSLGGTRCGLSRGAFEHGVDTVLEDRLNYKCGEPVERYSTCLPAVDGWFQQSEQILDQAHQHLEHAAQTKKKFADKQHGESTSYKPVTSGPLTESSPLQSPQNPWKLKAM